MSAARNVLLAALIVAGLGGAAWFWEWFNRSTHPRGLLEIATESYAHAPNLRPFVSQDGPPYERLFGVTEADAMHELSACPIKSWKHVGALAAPDDGGGVHGNRLFHLWECDRPGRKLLAAELWNPHMGVDGVFFAACKLNQCPPYAQAIPEIRRWLGDDSKPVADRPSR